MPIIKNVAIPINIPLRLYVSKNSIMVLMSINKKTDPMVGFFV